MGNSIQLDSIVISNFIQFTFWENGNIYGQEGDGMRRQKIFLGKGRRSYLVRVFFLEVCNWFKSREKFCWVAKDVRDS